MNKKILLIVSIAAAFLALGGIAFFLFYRQTAPSPSGTAPTSIFGWLPIIGGRSGPATPPEEIQTPPEGEIPTPSPEAIARRAVQLTDEAIVGPTFDAKRQKILYYKKGDGHLISNNADGGNEETVSNLTILNILEVLWSPDKKKTIILYQDGDELKKFITDATSTPKVAFLPQESTTPVWSPDGRSIWWLAKQADTYALVSADTNGKNQKKLGFATPMAELTLSVIAPDIALLVPKTVSFFETPLFLFSLKTAILNPALTGFGLLAVSDPNPKTQNIVYTRTSRAGALDDLHLLDLKSGKDTSWPLKTLATKCAFSQDSKLLFCAVPQKPPVRDLPEAWFQGKISFADAIYKIDLTSGKAEEIFHEGGDIISLITSDDAKKLFFIDRKTGFLYGLSLE